jgi:hypothetical protein
MSAGQVRELVEHAKARSEVAPGVGEQSRVLVTGSEGDSTTPESEG